MYLFCYQIFLKDEVHNLKSLSNLLHTDKKKRKQIPLKHPLHVTKTKRCSSVFPRTKHSHPLSVSKTTVSPFSHNEPHPVFSSPSNKAMVGIHLGFSTKLSIIESVHVYTLFSAYN